MPKYLSSFFSAQSKNITLFVMYTIIISALAIGRGRAYGELIDALIHANTSNQQEVFLLAMTSIIVIEIILFALRIPYDFIYSRCRGYMNIHARVFGVDKIIGQQYSTLAQMGSGKLLQIVHNGMEGYSYLIYDGLRVSIDTSISLIAMIIMVGLGNSWFIVYIIGGGLLLWRFQRIAFARLTSVRLIERDLNESYTKQTAKILMNFLLITIYKIKDQELDRLRQIGQSRVNNYARLKLRFNGVASGGNLLLVGLMLATTFVFGMKYLNGTMELSFVMTVFFLTNFAREGLYKMGIFLAELGEKLTYIQRYDEMTESPNLSDKKTTTIEKFGHDIIFRSISFAYEGGNKIIDDISLTIPWGQKVAILGRSGSGKSTLCKLLSRLIQIQQGDIILQHTTTQTSLSLYDLPIDNLYHHIGYLYQEPLVFDGSVRDNLSLHTSVNDDTLQQALITAGLDHTLTLNTIVGEQGLLLSGGEKQRLALARAFVFDYSVLILDEPTSNLDADLEQKLLSALFHRYQHKTIICITHRPFVLDMVERTITMKQGMIIDDNTQKS